MVPIGIEVSRADVRRRGALTPPVGTPIPLIRHADAYRATFRHGCCLTAELRERIEGLVVHLDDLTQAPIVDAAFEVFAPDRVGIRCSCPRSGTR